MLNIEFIKPIFVELLPNACFGTDRLYLRLSIHLVDFQTLHDMLVASSVRSHEKKLRIRKIIIIEMYLFPT